MNYLKLKQKIYEAIERNPLDRSAYEEMFAVCREYEKIDFQTAHAWNHELRNHISRGLRMTVSCQKFDEAREFDDLMFRSLLFGAQHFFDDYLQAVEYGKPLTICGMPNRNGGSSTSDTGSAVIMRDGWSAAEARAKDSELMFKKSERIFLKVVLNICHTLADMDLKVCNVEIRFTRRNYENILQKAQVLDLMLKNNKIHPRLAFEHCGLFVDSDLAYTLSAEYAEEQEQKAQELFEQQQRMKQEGNDDDSGNNEGNGGADGKSAETREQSGNTD